MWIQILYRYFEPSWTCHSSLFRTSCLWWCLLITLFTLPGTYSLVAGQFHTAPLTNVSGDYKHALYWNRADKKKENNIHLHIRTVLSRQETDIQNEAKIIKEKKKGHDIGKDKKRKFCLSLPLRSRGTKTRRDIAKHRRDWWENVFFLYTTVRVAGFKKRHFFINLLERYWLFSYFVLFRWDCLR